MLNFITGDLLKSEAEALVNTVNTVGVMGKGIALQFKESFPINNKAYIDACKNNKLNIGEVLPVWDNNLIFGRKLIINFPTKKHWRQPSKYEYIEQGLIALVELLKSERIKSIAIPPLGCGNGGLNWNIVKEMIYNHLRDLQIEIFVYEPNAEIKILLQKQESKKLVNLTAARAQLMSALFLYEGMGEYSSLFAANKLAYFLQRMGQPLKLNFQPHLYGPYALGVEKVLYAMNGVFLKGLEQQEIRPFDPLNLNYQKWQEVKDFIDKELSEEDVKRLNNLKELINGFTSELSLEILSTTAYILEQNPSFTYNEVLTTIIKWSDRKARLFKPEYVQSAYDHLKKCETNFTLN